MRAGSKVRCVDASPAGCPLEEGKLYTVKRYEAHGEVLAWRAGEECIPDREGHPGVLLCEVKGAFLASRFEEVTR